MSYANGSPMNGATLLQSVLPEYFLAKCLRHPATCDHYRRSIKQFTEHLGHPAALRDLTDSNLASFMMATVDAGLSEHTANQRAKQLRALWEWAARKRLIESFPTVKPLKVPEQNPCAYTMEQLHALFNHCTKEPGWIGPRPAGLFWLSMHYWLFDSAARIGETIALTWPMVDLPSNMARLPGEIRKNGKRANYKLSPRTVELLTELKTYPTVDDLVWYIPFQMSSFEHRYRRLVAGAGIPYQRCKSGPHKMRRTVLTMIECNGGNATAFAQHSSRKVTESYIDSCMVAAHGKGDWPIGVDPLLKRGFFDRLFRR